jgi:hypothetical protein
MNPEDLFRRWYSENCSMIVPAEDEIKSLMGKSFKAGLEAGQSAVCCCTCSNCSGCLA